VRYRSGSWLATSRASDAPLVCSPLLSTKTHSSPSESCSPSGLIADDFNAAAGDLDVTLPHESWQRRRLVPGPDRAGVLAGLTPSGREPAQALAVGKPARSAAREVGVHDQRQRTDTDQVVYDRGDRVITDRLKAVEPCPLLNLARKHRFGAEALEHRRERDAIALEDVGGASVRGLDPPPVRFAERVHRPRCKARGKALRRVEHVVIDPGLAVAHRFV